MKRPTTLAAIVFLATSSAAFSSDSVVQLELFVSRVKSECGIDLRGTFAKALTGVTFEPAKGFGFVAKASAQPRGWKDRAQVNFVFNCRAQVQPKASDAESVPRDDGAGAPSQPMVVSAAKVIEEEDSGGRYYRHVAFERKITGRNWQGTIAYVDGLFGDGQKSPMSFLLACNDMPSRPCIQVEIKPPVRGPSKRLEPILEMVRSVTYSSPDAARP